MNELAQAFDLMEKAEEEYIGDLEWKRDSSKRCTSEGASLQKGVATCTIRRRIAKIPIGRAF